MANLNKNCESLTDQQIEAILADCKLAAGLPGLPTGRLACATAPAGDQTKGENRKCGIAEEKLCHENEAF